MLLGNFLCVHLLKLMSNLQVIGFLTLGFEPPMMVLEQGEEMTGHVNITVPDLSSLVGSSLHVCCADDTVAFTPYQDSTFITQVKTIPYYL